MKMTINTTQIQKGDFVVGYKQKVQHVDVDRWRVMVTFEDGEQWRTAAHFETTVIREAPSGAPDCAECGKHPSDYPANLCVGCAAYSEHAAI